jgi:Fic family protein
MSVFNKNIPYNDLPDLPASSLETVELFKLTIKANKILAELKGYCQTLPNPSLLLNTIILQESKESSAIENIVTTQDELYKAAISIDDYISDPAAKEVLLYRQAMYWGLEEMKKNDLITTNLLVGIMQYLNQTTAGIRNTPGTN